MFESFIDTVQVLRAEVATYPTGVQVWMRVMSISYLLGIFVAFFNRRALFLVGIMVLTALSLITVKTSWPEFTRFQIGAVAHLILWPFALLALWWRVPAPLHRVFSLWRLWVTALIGISLVLDLWYLLF